MVCILRVPPPAVSFHVHLYGRNYHIRGTFFKAFLLFNYKQEMEHGIMQSRLPIAIMLISSVLRNIEILLGLEIALSEMPYTTISIIL